MPSMIPGRRIDVLSAPLVGSLTTMPPGSIVQHPRVWPVTVGQQSPVRWTHCGWALHARAGGGLKKMASVQLVLLLAPPRASLRTQRM